MRIIPLRLVGPIALMVAAQALPQPQAAKRPNEVNLSSLDLYEAVVRFQIKSWQSTANTYCIEINGADPGPACLLRLRPLHVKGASACQKLNDKTQMIVVDGKNKGAVIFD